MGGSKEVSLVWVVTSTGVSAIYSTNMTLATKSEAMLAIVPRHLRYDLVSLCSLPKPGDVNGCVVHPADSDSLWTSLFLAAESFRYAATKDPSAKESSTRTFNALRRLMTITGVPGLTARTICKVEDNCSGGTWYESTVEPGWMWKGDASSDDTTGQLFGQSLYYLLVAETEEEREIAGQSILSMVDYIHDHDYYLLDVTGNHTKWGVWNPNQLNHDATWYSERGPNSAQILGYLAQGWLLSNQSKLRDGFDWLGLKNQYGLNMQNARVTMPTDVNDSDDELLWMAFSIFGVARLQLHDTDVLSPEVDRLFQQAIMRAFSLIRDQHPTWYTFLFYSLLDKEYAPLQDAFRDQDLRLATQSLRRWPMSLVDWPVNNSERIDITISPYLYREELQVAERAFPPDQRSCLWWNCCRRVLVSGSGMTEYSPAAWLLPYWMARFFGVVNP